MPDLQLTEETKKTIKAWIKLDAEKLIRTIFDTHGNRASVDTLARFQFFPMNMHGTENGPGSKTMPGRNVDFN